MAAWTLSYTDERECLRSLGRASMMIAMTENGGSVTGAEREERWPRSIRRSRTGGIWVSVIVAIVVLIFLLVFILQNIVTVTVRFLWMAGSLPLGVALLFAVIGGALLVALIGTARILQLRRAARKAVASHADSGGEKPAREPEFEGTTEPIGTAEPDMTTRTTDDQTDDPPPSSGR